MHPVDLSVDKFVGVSASLFDLEQVAGSIVPFGDSVSQLRAGLPNILFEGFVTPAFVLSMWQRLLQLVDTLLQTAAGRRVVAVPASDGRLGFRLGGMCLMSFGADALCATCAVVKPLGNGLIRASDDRVGFSYDSSGCVDRLGTFFVEGGKFGFSGADLFSNR
ncbi:MAG: hypothetical protein C0607_16100 [Azoarcus sp.]|nr:MAG: hypothetical protein C0607_16100 [Azoarcus sp.]